MAETSELKPGFIFQQITTGIERARVALEEVAGKLTDFDSAHQAKETAAGYLSGAMNSTRQALAELSKTAQTLGGDATEIPVKAFTNALAQASTTFTKITEAAQKYDEQHQLSTTVASVIAAPKDQASLAIATVAGYVAAAAAAANAQLQGVSDGLRVNLLPMLASAAQSGLDKTLPAAAKADETLQISQRAEAASKAVCQKAKDLDERYQVLTRAKELDERFGLSGYVGVAVGSAQTLDQKLTGGKVSPSILAAYGMGLEMAGYVRERFEEAKRATKEEQSLQEAAPVKE
eukprot:NODE_3047_length_1040_cov_40.527930_g2905_i0.p1 GENE.NODE_3047_length_1040_cov_40.527930_g2905_i0~~NODE_3047_length_1040_cov_40.527930_g2905_i0.p1  ORF type:complete len:291 (+),score=84.69 NODE_3047_length_1040_cov_40.527930_g2905_i0:8-880(+)